MKSIANYDHSNELLGGLRASDVKSECQHSKWCDTCKEKDAVIRSLIHKLAAMEKER